MGRLFNYANNMITVAGVILTTISAILIIIFIIADMIAGFENPYTAIFSYAILPGFFVAGLLAIPIGIFLRRRRLVADGAAPEELDRYPRLNFNDPHLRRLALVVVGLTAINAVIFGTSSYLSVHAMETVAFCGTVCHTVMQPEYAAYQGSPHSRVNCVECHIGPGAPWFVRSKIDGLRQVWRTSLDTYDRPIETPIHNLRPARETCEQCHWPAKHHGDKLRIFARFETDEANTPSYSAMLLKTGGGSLDLGRHGGIHWWHIYSDNRIRYLAEDKQRQEIVWVELTTPDGEVRTYTRDGSEPPSAEELEADARVMDCIDCHNRPTHLFPSPSSALDGILESRPELRKLPYFKREGLRAIEVDYPEHQVGVESVRQAVLDFYSSEYSELASQKAKLVELAAESAAGVYGRSVFPEMGVNWQTHPNNIGHEEFAGCSRCHDGELITADEEYTIPDDCDTCHTFLVEDSATVPDLEMLID
jgi:nitrate/TMAO reductase-like tetraheme cytochrome c subunit